MSKQIDLVKKYVKIVQDLQLNEETAKDLLHPDYSQWELPNQLNKTGQQSDALDSFKRIQTAKMILSSQKYDITSILEQNQTVVIETLWSGTMAMDAGPLKNGQEIKAFICMFFEFKEDKIYRIRNYDCFEPLHT